MMRPLDQIEDSLIQNLEGDTASLTGIEIAALIPMVLDMFVTLVSTCRGNKESQISAMKEDTALRRIAARRVVNKAVKKSKIKVKRHDKIAMVQTLLTELDSTTPDDLAEIVSEVNTVDWGSL